jgi:uncharacterized protein YecE (DUF72 family)
MEPEFDFAKNLSESRPPAANPHGFDRARVKAAVAHLANRGLFIGTSSWKYPGWQGMLYDRERYVLHGRYSESRFERGCLAEYAGVFGTVGVDAAYYKFPDRAYLEALVSQVPEGFLFGLKVTDEITIRTFANLPRFGARAGKTNEHFLDADLFLEGFLRPCEPFRRNLGLLMFEFSRVPSAHFQHGSEFVEALDAFLDQLPKGWPYGVEVRNRGLLKPDYFAVLRRHGVAHIFSSWEAMPPVAEQMALPESRTNPELSAARFLLRPGRRYEHAVRAFSPYDRVREVNRDGRQAGAALIREALSSPPTRRTFVFVNNRFEGNALQTIEAMIEGSGVV